LDRPEPCGPGGYESCLLFTCAAPPCTLSLAASPGSLVKGRRVASGYPSVQPSRVAPRPPSGEKDASHQLLQPTHDTSTLSTARFPAARCAGPRGPLPCADPPSAMASGGSQVELRLTATLQLQRGHNPPDRMVRDLGPGRRPGRDPARSWRSLDRGSSALGLPAAVFSTARRARSVASDALCRGSSRPNLIGWEADPTLRPNPRVSHQAPPPPPPRQRRPLRRNQSAFYRQVPLPRSGSRRLRLSPRPFSRRCSRNDQAEGTGSSRPSPYSRLCRHEPVSDAPSPPEHKAGWLDPGATLDQTPLVDFCNQNNPRAQPPDRSILRLVLSTRRAQLALDWEETSGKGGARSATPTADSGQPLVSARARTLRFDRHASTRRWPRFHGSGAGRLTPPGTSRHPRS
jgi:hypothetical protein